MGKALVWIGGGIILLVFLASWIQYFIPLIVAAVVIAIIFFGTKAYIAHTKSRSGGQFCSHCAHVKHGAQQCNACGCRS